MQILVVGMGLIGGSICKSIKAVTEHTVYGCDVRQDVLEQALEDGSIDGTGTMEDGAYDMIIVCLHQRIAISLIQKALPRIKAGTILVDACGLKGKMVRDLTYRCQKAGVFYVGTHPMAGREKAAMLPAFPTCSRGKPDRHTGGRHAGTRPANGHRAGKGDRFRADYSGNPHVARQHDRLHLPAGTRGVQFLCQGLLHGRCALVLRRQLSGHDTCGNHGRNHVGSAVSGQSGQPAVPPRPAH